MTQAVAGNRSHRTAHWPRTGPRDQIKARGEVARSLASILLCFLSTMAQGEQLALLSRGTSSKVEVAGAAMPLRSISHRHRPHLMLSRLFLRNTNSKKMWAQLHWWQNYQEVQSSEQELTLHAILYLIWTSSMPILKTRRHQRLVKCIQALSIPKMRQEKKWSRYWPKMPKS